MHFFNDQALDQFLQEDVPYFDLTTNVTGIGDKPGTIRFRTREETVLCGTEEAAGIFDRLNVKVSSYLPSGTKVGPGEVIFEATGAAAGLHMGWKVSVNILEYASGIATRTHRLVTKAKAVQPRLQIVTTRKIFPGTKALSIKAVLAGGAMPHRLGLSETILIFEEHLRFMGGIPGLLIQLDSIKANACEKKILVEVKSLQDGIALCRAGVDGIQFDKLTCLELSEAVKVLKKMNPQLLLVGTGGIHEGNVADYAATGVDTINTTAVYFGKPADIGAELNPIES